MDTAIGTFQADKEAAFTPTPGEVKPRDIFWLGRREIDEKTVTNLGKALARDDSFFHPILVRAEGEAGYRLISGLHRVEASKRRRGEDRPIPAIIYPPDTPDERISMLEIEENLFRHELSPAEREAQTIRWVVAFKKLNGGNPLTPVSETAEAVETGNSVPRLAPGSGGRGKKGLAQKFADNAGINKRAVRKRLKAASARIGEKIDLDHDTPEELERKAAELEKVDKRQRAEPKFEQPKRRKPAPRSVSEDPTPPAKPHAGKIGRLFEFLWKLFIAIGKKYQLRFIYHACLHLGLDPLRMAPPAVFGLADEDPDLAEVEPAEVAPATHGAAVAQSGEREDAAELGAEDLQVSDDEASEDTHAGSDDADDLASEHADEDTAEDADDEVSKTADQEPGGATKCAYCNIDFEDGDQLMEFDGQLYHHFCVEDGKRLAKAKQGKQIAIAA